MVDMAAIASAASALKSAFDISKVALGLRDAALIRAKVSEMQGEISSALANAITAQTDQMAMLEEVGNLKQQIAKMKAWNTEKKRYKMRQLAVNAPTYAYAIKPDCQGDDPFYCICTKCYENGEKSVLQFTRSLYGTSQITLKCPVCTTEFHAERWPPP